jgi:hypothetical protein
MDGTLLPCLLCNLSYRVVDHYTSEHCKDRQLCMRDWFVMHTILTSGDVNTFEVIFPTSHRKAQYDATTSSDGSVVKLLLCNREIVSWNSARTISVKPKTLK